MKNVKTKEKFIELRAKGMSFEKIAKELKVSKQTLINWSKELSIMISNYKAIELEALQEKFHMTKKAKIELFGEKLVAIKEELEKRDLSKMPTAKLFELLERYSKVLQEERHSVTFQKESDLRDVDFTSDNAYMGIDKWQA